MNRFFLRSAAAALLTVSLLSAAHAGVSNLGGTHENNQLRFPSSSTPSAALNGSDTFTAVVWLYQRDADRDPGQSNTVLLLEGLLELSYDWSADSIDATLMTDAGPVTTSVHDFTTTGMVGGELPTDAWVLCAVTWSEPAGAGQAGTLTMRVRSDAVPAARALRGGRSAPGARGAPLPAGFRSASALGATDAHSVALGANSIWYGSPTARDWTGIRCVALRDHLVNDADVNAMFDSRSPTAHFAMNTASNGGLMNGPNGCIWAGGLFHPINPVGVALPNAVGALPGDSVLPNNTGVFVRAGSSVALGDLDRMRPVTPSTASTFAHVNPFAEGESWSGFFTPRIDASSPTNTPVSADLGSMGSRFVLQEYDGPLRVLTWSNSRGVRTHTLNGRTLAENHAYGFVAEHLADQCGGFNIPINSGQTTWFGQDTLHGGYMYTNDDVPSITRANLNLRSFQRYWSGAGLFSPGNGAVSGGGGVALRPGAAIELKFHPEPGTKLTATDPATFEIYHLMHGQNAQMTVTPVKGSSLAAAGTPIGGPVVIAPPAPVALQVAAADSASQLRFAGDQSAAVSIGDAAFQFAFHAANMSINAIESVTVNAGETIVTFEFPWLTIPAPGSTLSFGKRQAERYSVQLPGLAQGDPENHRGMRIENTGNGIVALFAQTYYINDCDGELHGPLGWGGAGYVTQLPAAFSGALERMFELLDADLLIASTADQLTPASYLIPATDVARAGKPSMEVIWYDPPQMSDTDWTSICTNPMLAETHGIVGLTVRDHPLVGDKYEQYARFGISDYYHFSAEGNRFGAEAFFDRLTPYATPSKQCHGDVASNGVVNVFDLLELLGNWGTNGAGAALAQPDDIVDLLDLLELLSNWGPCP